MVKGLYGFDIVNYDMLKKELKFKKEGSSSQDIVDWRNKHRKFSIYVIDPFYNLYVNEPTIKKKKKIMILCYMVKDNDYYYPILNDGVMKRNPTKHC